MNKQTYLSEKELEALLRPVDIQEVWDNCEDLEDKAKKRQPSDGSKTLTNND